MFSRKYFLFVGFLFLFLFSNQYTPVASVQTSSTQVKHDEVYRTLTVTIVNATIYDDRASAPATPGHISFQLKIEDKTNTTQPVSVNSPPAYTMNVNWTVNRNITTLPNNYVINVWDNASGLDVNTNFLGNISIPYTKDGTFENYYNTSHAIGGSPDPQATLYVRTEVKDYSFLVNPVITLNTNDTLYYKVDTTEHFLNFSIYDDNPNYYTISRNGYLQYSSGWVNNKNILVNIDNLAMGNYNFTIAAIDLYHASTVVIVHVSVTTTGTESANPTNTQVTGTNRKLDYPGFDVLALGMVLPAIIILKKRKK